MWDSKLTSWEVCSLLHYWQLDLHHALKGCTVKLFRVPTEMSRPWESCPWPAGFPVSLFTAGSAMHGEESCAYTRVDTPVCVYKLCSCPANSYPSGQESRALTAQSALRRLDLGRRPVQTPAVSMGLWGQGILGFWVLGDWSGTWAMDSGVRESLAVEIAYPMGRAAQNGPLK